MEFNARICSVKELFDEKAHYTVPSYQNRVKDLSFLYVNNLIDNIIEGYKKENDKPCFLETIVLSSEKEIIDGQKRILILSILLKELSFHFQDNEKIKNLKFSFLETKAFNGSENESFSKYFLGEKKEDLDVKDKGVGRISFHIRDIYFNLGLFRDKKIDIDSFIDYLFQKVVFNVIKVELSSLLDSIGMFRMLNIEGKAPNSILMFRFKLFDYLSCIKGMEAEKALKKISDLFLYSDDISDKCRKVSPKTYELGCEMPSFIHLYKLILILKYNLTLDAFLDSDIDFFNSLLSTLSEKDKVQEEGREEIEIDLSEIKSVQDIVLMCHSDFINRPLLEQFLYCILSSTQYSEYFHEYSLCVPYLFFHKDDLKGLYSFLFEFYKLLFVCNVCFLNEIQVREIILEILSKIKGESEDLYKLIQEEKNRIGKRYCFRKRLSASFVDEERKKDICTLFEFIKMKDYSPLTYRDYFHERFLLKDYDFIPLRTYPRKDLDPKNLSSSIGNTLLIEHELMSKAFFLPFLEKKKIFKKSKFYTSHSLSDLFQKELSEDDIMRRKDNMIEEIMNYIYS